MSLEDVFASYTNKIVPRITRAHLGFTLKTPANDTHPQHGETQCLGTPKNAKLRSSACNSRSAKGRLTPITLLAKPNATLPSSLATTLPTNSRQCAKRSVEQVVKAGIVGSHGSDATTVELKLLVDGLILVAEHPPEGKSHRFGAPTVGEVLNTCGRVSHFGTFRAGFDNRTIAEAAGVSILGGGGLTL